MEQPNSSINEDIGEKVNIIDPEEPIQSYENNHVQNTSSNNTSTFDFTEKSWMTDFILIVEGIRLHVAINILALASPVFAGMFRSELKESLSDELELPGKNVEDVREFLRCIYPNTLHQVTHDNALKVLPLLEEYQVVQLKPKCENVLCASINKGTPIEELLFLMEEAIRYNLSVLCEKCVTLAINNSEEVLDEAISNCSASSKTLNALFQKIIHSSRARIKGLEEVNAELIEELDLFKWYISAEMRKNASFKFDNGLNWKGCQFVLSVKTLNDKIQAEKEFKLWDIPMTVTVLKEWNWLQLEIIKCVVQEIDCDLKAHFVLVNRQPRGKNRVAIIDQNFSGGAIQGICKYSEVEALSNGFIRDGRFGLIVNIYMSEPNKQ